MKITGIEIKQYAKPLDPPFLASWDPNPRVKFASTIVYVYTDEGITGIGSGDLMTGFAGHEKFFIGKDPFEMENHNKIIDNIDFHYGRCWPLLYGISLERNADSPYINFWAGNRIR